MNITPEQLREAADIIEQGLGFEQRLANTSLWVPSNGTWTTLEYLQSGFEIRRKPWALVRSINGHTLADGQEWHRQDWTKEMLPAPYRPLTMDECDGKRMPGSEYCDVPENFKENGFTRNDEGGGWVVKGVDGFYRTTRPLPTPPDPYAEEKAAFARGETIQAWFSLGPCWADLGNPDWTNPNVKMRVKPSTVMVPLGPGDVAPGSVFQPCSWESYEHVNYEAIIKTGVRFILGFGGEVGGTLISWKMLMDEKWLILRPGSTWQPCHKPQEEKHED